MADPRSSLRSIVKKLSAEWMDVQPAWLGDHDQVVLTDIAGMYNARLINAKVIQVYNNARVPPDFDIPVKIGRHKDSPTIWQIIEARQVYPVPVGGTRVEYHGAQHMFLGPDELPVDRRQIVQLTVRVFDAAGFIVRVYPDARLTTNGYKKIVSQNVDLSSYVVTSGARYVSIESDEEGELSVHQGTTFAAAGAAQAFDLPIPEFGKHTRAHILFYEGQTGLSDNDISIPMPPDFNHTMWIRRYIDMDVAPTASDDVDAGYRIGDHWFTHEEYGTECFVCLDDSPDAAEWLQLGEGGIGGSSAWGDITGTLSDQTDLQSALDSLSTSISNHTTDTTDAHDASAISVADVGGNFTGDDVEEVLAELFGLLPVPAGAELLHSQLLSSNTATINVYPAGSIPATGKDLHIRISARTNRAAAGAEGIDLEINDDATASNYSIYVMFHWFNSLWDDQTPASNRTFGYANATNAPANTFAVYELFIYDYASTTKIKSLQSRGGQRIGTGASDQFIYDAKGEWLSTAAITKVEFTGLNGGSFVSGCLIEAWLEG